MEIKIPPQNTTTRTPAVSLDLETDLSAWRSVSRKILGLFVLAEPEFDYRALQSSSDHVRTSINSFDRPEMTMELSPSTLANKLTIVHGH